MLLTHSRHSSSFFDINSSICEASSVWTMRKNDLQSVAFDRTIALCVLIIGNLTFSHDLRIYFSSCLCKNTKICSNSKTLIGIAPFLAVKYPSWINLYSKSLMFPKWTAVSLSIASLCCISRSLKYKKIHLIWKKHK